MNTFRNRIVIGLTVLGMGATALAAHADVAPDGPAAHQGKERGDWRAARMARYEARLHDTLQLTPAQEPAWRTFISAMTPPAGRPRPERAAVATMTAPQRMENMLSMMKAREAAMSRNLAALKTFYATLTPAQQKAFDANVPGGGQFGGRDHRWHG